MTEYMVILADMNEWRDFAADNYDALCEQYESIDNALRHALDGLLRLGGGAAPIVDVKLKEDSSGSSSHEPQ
jgi:hypothetical protein